MKPEKSTPNKEEPILEKHKRYGGKVLVLYDDGPHVYEVDGSNVVFPSVTKITDILDKPFLRKWYVNRSIAFVQEQIHPGVPYDEIQLEEIFKDARWGGNKARDHAASLGRKIHEWIEKHITHQIASGKKDNLPMPVHSGMKASISKFLAWEEEEKPQYILSEYRNVSLEHSFSGTLDIVYRDRGGDLIVADIKTGKGTYPEHFLQSAGYCIMLEEENPPQLEADGYGDLLRTIIHIPLIGKLSVKEPKNPLDKDEEAFLALSTAYRWRENL